MTEMSVSRSAAGVTVLDGRVFVSGGHDGLQIFNTVGPTASCFLPLSVLSPVGSAPSCRWSSTTITPTAGTRRRP